MTAPGHSIAHLVYEPGQFSILNPGSHVLCAVTGQAIAVDELRYWSHELQEAYSDAAAATQRYAQARAQGRL